MIDTDRLNRIKKHILDYVSDDYTQIGGIAGNLIFYDAPEFAKDEPLLKEYVLAALSELLSEKKIRVGVLSDNANGSFLTYWKMSDEDIVNKIDKDWGLYFNNPKWDYGQNPTFDLTEEYARQIGKYQSDQEKFEKEKPKQ